METAIKEKNWASSYERIEAEIQGGIRSYKQVLDTCMQDEFVAAMIKHSDVRIDELTIEMDPTGAFIDPEIFTAYEGKHRCLRILKDINLPDPGVREEAG